ncbi:hypothetical protein AGMMS49992_07640 [Clostridia bacterium]|nr:hypothetical protein AGMMS49992_07640 [Clostridia bacterium]
MTRAEWVNYWLATAHHDEGIMVNNYNSGDYDAALFFGHLVIEKMLKALYVQNPVNDFMAPRLHNLVTLAQGAGIELSDIQERQLRLITTFNMDVRYPDERLHFYKLCTKEYASDKLETIREVQEWLSSNLAS